MKKYLIMASVGWYLFTPPTSRYTRAVLTEAPIQYWTQWAAFESADKCEEMKDAMREDMKSFKLVNHPGYMSPEEIRDSFNSSICIASDDPRLNK